MNVELHRKLADICDRYAIIGKYEQAIAQIESNVDWYLEDYKKTKKRGFSAVPGVLLITFSSAIIWFVFILCAYSFAEQYGMENKAAALVMPLSYLTIVLIPALPILYKFTFCRWKNKKIQKRNDRYYAEKYAPAVEECADNIINLQIERDKFIANTQYILDFLPTPYRYDLAAAYMEQAVRTGRAETLKEAMNLFEEQLHRWKLESQGQQLLEQNAIRNQMLSDSLASIESSQRRMESSLRNIEDLEFYNTFCR